MSKKTFTVSIHEVLYKELEKRAKRDHLTVQELINFILWKSAKTTKYNTKRPRKVEEFLELFSRHKPKKLKGKKYFCNECGKDHKYASKIGQRHIKYAN